MRQGDFIVAMVIVGIVGFMSGDLIGRGFGGDGLKVGGGLAILFLNIHFIFNGCRKWKD